MDRRDDEVFLAESASPLNGGALRVDRHESSHQRRDPEEVVLRWCRVTADLREDAHSDPPAFRERLSRPFGSRMVFSTASDRQRNESSRIPARWSYGKSIRGECELPLPREKPGNPVARPAALC